VERDHLRGEIVKLKAEVDRLTKALDAALFQQEELADQYSRESRQSTEAIEVWKANCRTADRRCGELDRLHTNQAETIRGQRSTIETLKVERDTWKAEALTLRDRVGATPQSPPRQSLTDKLRQDILTAPPGRTSLDAIEALRVFEDYVRAQERAAKEANPLVKAGSSKSKISLLKEGNDISVFDNGLAEPGLRWRVTMKDGRWTEFASP
jgi:chromosome segregation ATPase